MLTTDQLFGILTENVPEGSPIEVYALVRSFAEATVELCQEAAAEEREACAMICRTRAGVWDADPPDGQEREYAMRRDEALGCEASIRERSTPAI